jgi:hypothetical protein
MLSKDLFGRLEMWLEKSIRNLRDDTETRTFAFRILSRIWT